MSALHFTRDAEIDAALVKTATQGIASPAHSGPGRVPAESEVAPHPVPYSVEKAEREVRCLFADVLHQCALPKGHEGLHHCLKCDHAWESERFDTFRAATSDSDLCWFKAGDFDMGAPQ